MEATETQAMTIRPPKALYERVRREAYDQHTSQTAIITEALTEHYERIDANHHGPDEEEQQT